MVLFSSGYETGNFTEWDAGAGGAAVQTVTKYHGKYAMECYTSGDSSYKTIANASNIVYLSFWFRLNTLLVTNNTITLAYLVDAADANNIMLYQMWPGASPPATGYVGITTKYPTSVDTYTVGTAKWRARIWYFAELEFIRAAGTAGGYWAWLNNQLVCSYTGIDTSGAPAGYFISVGEPYNSGPNITLQVDNVTFNTGFLPYKRPYGDARWKFLGKKSARVIA